MTRVSVALSALLLGPIASCTGELEVGPGPSLTDSDGGAADGCADCTEPNPPARGDATSNTAMDSAAPCIAQTCEDLGAGCGPHDDGCGGMLDCGECNLDELFDPERITTWDPGITLDTQLGLPLRDNGLPLRETICATLSAGDDIAAAIRSCDEGGVVMLSPGTYNVSSTLTLNRSVVLRGSGSEGAPTGTTIVRQGGGSVLAIGEGRDQTCYGGNGYALRSDGLKESRVIDVGDAARHFSAGDLALIDVVDQSPVDQGDCPYFKREDGRSLSQRVEITEVNTEQGTLTLGSPLHWSFRADDSHRAEITPVGGQTVKWAGIEHLRIQGGRNTGYNGQMAGGIDISNAAYSWVEDVQTDETIGGMHVSLTGTYRVVIRDSYYHHSANYGFGADCYGIVLRCGAAENLVENNIVRYMNKPIMMNVTGGGNVIAYNYADNSWASPAEWQEVNIDCHCSFPHMELIEGNFAPHMGATTTHGNAGYLTFYRNYSSSVFADPAVAGSRAQQSGNIAALQLQGSDVGMNAVGNVLGTEGYSRVLDSFDSSERAIYQLSGRGGESSPAVTTLYRHGNFDYVTMETRWDPARATRTLPPSLYLERRPRWWPSDSPWPWVGPDRSPMVGTLPAKSRSDAMP